jgi:hypothetical protein
MGPGSMMGAPGMMAGHPYAAMYGQMPGAPMQQPAADALKPFDASKMKASRLGHYGYLEGRGEWVGLSRAEFRTRRSTSWLPSRGDAASTTQLERDGLPADQVSRTGRIDGVLSHVGARLTEERLGRRLEHASRPVRWWWVSHRWLWAPLTSVLTRRNEQRPTQSLYKQISTLLTPVSNRPAWPTRGRGMIRTKRRWRLMVGSGWVIAG